VSLRLLEHRPTDGRLAAGLTAVALVPIWVATARAAADGWLAIGDNGIFLIRSRDVLTAHHPFLGTWTSASLSLGEDVNNPGPLLWDVLALPARLGGSIGMAAGVAVLNSAAVVIVAAALWRVGGLRLATTGLLAATGLVWTMGSELLFDPWQPHSLLLPFLALVALVWAMTCGHTTALPFAAAVASLIVQTHLSYAVLVPVLCLWGVVWLVRAHGRALARPAVVTAVVLALCWAQPLWDQLFGEGNLLTLAGNVGSAEETVGPSLGTRIVADVVATPPWWARPSFADAVNPPPGQPSVLEGAPNIANLPSSGAALVSIGAVGALLAAAWSVARRRRDAAARAGVGIAALALLLVLAATASLPVGQLGVAPHQVRFLWPVSAFVTAVLALVLVRRPLVLGVGVVVLAALALPHHNAGAGPAADAEAIPVVRALAAQLGSLEGRGPVLYDTRLRFAEPWNSALMAELQSRGIEFHVDDEGWLRQLGSRRRHDGRAVLRLFVREGAAAREVPEGARRVAHHEGIDAGEQAELERLETSLADLRVRLNAAGQAALAAGTLRAFADGPPTARRLLETGELAALVRNDLLSSPPSRRRALDRYADLRHRADRHTVAVFVADEP
jgi:hypothetical protein